MLDKLQVKRLHALAAAAGMSVSSPDRTDDLHALIAAETGKISTLQLTESEFHTIGRLIAQLKGMPKKSAQKKPPTPKPESRPGMMTAKQQAYAWHLIYELCDLDPSAATPGERMIGAIRKIIGIEASAARPFAWISFEQGRKFLTTLKYYVDSATRRAAKGGRGSG